MEVNWEAVAALATSIEALVILITGPLIYRQLLEMKRTTIADALTRAFAYLQDEKVREGRKVLFEFSKPNINDWTSEERISAELACNAFDMVGIMIANGVMPAKIITSEYQDGIIRSWQNAQPLIQWNRQHKKPDYWDDFEMLYRIAKAG